ncbi:MAG: transposase [bacterium]
MIGAMRPDAVLTALPEERVKGKAGRPAQRGPVLPKPVKLADDARSPWQSCKADLYGHTRMVSYKECLAQWYRAAGTRLLRIVIVRVDTGKLGIRVFFSTDVTMTVQQVLETYAGRWSIEVAFRNLKQLMGFADSSARKMAAVERTAPFVGFVYTMLVLWFAEHAQRSALATPPLRPWYAHKVGFSFADVLRTAQRVLAPLDVLDPARSVANLHQLPHPASATVDPPEMPEPSREQRAA